MAYRKIDSLLWTSSTFRSMSEDGRTMYQYLLTCPHNNILCCFVLRPLYAADDLQWEPERVKKALAEVCSTKRPDGTPMVHWDEDKCLVVVHGQLEKEGIANENCATACIKVLRSLPTSSLIYAEVIRSCESLGKPHLKALIEELNKRLGQGLDNPLVERSQEPIPEQQEQEQEQEQESPGGDSVGSPGGDPAAGPPGPPTCPHQEIIALYHEILPELTHVEVWNDFRAGMLRQRWREDPKRQNLDWWRRFFGRVRASPLLLGQKRDFKADLEWLIRPKNFPKVLEGRYLDAGSKKRSGYNPGAGL